MRLTLSLPFYPVGGLRGVRRRLPMERAVEAASAAGGPGRVVGGALVAHGGRTPLTVLVVGALARPQLTRGALVGVAACRAWALQAGELRGHGPAALWPQGGVSEGGVCGREESDQNDSSDAAASTPGTSEKTIIPQTAIQNGENKTEKMLKGNMLTNISPAFLTLSEMIQFYVESSALRHS